MENGPLRENNGSNPGVFNFGGIVLMGPGLGSTPAPKSVAMPLAASQVGRSGKYGSQG